jgi:hypothetical protein
MFLNSTETHDFQKLQYNGIRSFFFYHYKLLLFNVLNHILNKLPVVRNFTIVYNFAQPFKTGFIRCQRVII